MYISIGHLVVKEFCEIISAADETHKMAKLCTFE